MIMSCETGRFETSTKTKIHTEHGTLLKIITYNSDGEDSTPYTEYRIRTKCHICGKTMECICFNVCNSDNPFNDAMCNLERYWICGATDCLIANQKEEDMELYVYFAEQYNNDKEAIAECIADQLGCMEEGDLCVV